MKVVIAVVARKLRCKCPVGDERMTIRMLHGRVIMPLEMIASIRVEVPFNFIKSQTHIKSIN